MTKLAIFQERYKLLFSAYMSASLIVRDPVPPHDPRLLIGFPNEMDYADVCTFVGSYASALRAYQVSLEDEAARLSAPA